MGSKVCAPLAIMLICASSHPSYDLVPVFAVIITSTHLRRLSTRWGFVIIQQEH